MTKIFNKKRKPAFTLAEVLITLTIIGVIAAMVIPNLIQRHFEHEMVTKLKKTYNVLNNAVALAIKDNGSVDGWDIGTTSSTTYEGSKAIFDYLFPYLKIQKDCGISTGCFASSYKAMFGNTLGSNNEADRVTNRHKFILEDGTSIAFQSLGTNCKSGSKQCANIHIDLNGQQGPNRQGWDYFLFEITPTSIKALGAIKNHLKSGDYQCTNNGTEDNINSKNGIFCAAHVIYKGNMDYLHRDIYHDWD